jgi:hypothetical protein
MEMTMLYARQMLGAYREALAEALQEVARQHAQPEAVRAALAELQEERRVSEKLRDHVKLLELRVLEVEKEKEELIVDLVAVKQTCVLAGFDWTLRWALLRFDSANGLCTGRRVVSLFHTLSLAEGWEVTALVAAD